MIQSVLPLAISRANLINTSVTSYTNIFATDLSPIASPCAFRIYACFDTMGVLAVERTIGEVTVEEQLNSGNALNAYASYAFDILVDSGDTINLQYSQDATALILKVHELGSEV